MIETTPRPKSLVSSGRYDLKASRSLDRGFQAIERCVSSRLKHLELHPHQAMIGEPPRRVVLRLALDLLARLRHRLAVGVLLNRRHREVLIQPTVCVA